MFKFFKNITSMLMTYAVGDSPNKEVYHIIYFVLQFFFLSESQHSLVNHQKLSVEDRRLRM